MPHLAHRNGAMLIKRLFFFHKFLCLKGCPAKRSFPAPVNHLGKSKGPFLGLFYMTLISYWQVAE